MNNSWSHNRVSLNDIVKRPTEHILHRKKNDYDETDSEDSDSEDEDIIDNEEIINKILKHLINDT